MIQKYPEESIQSLFPPWWVQVAGQPLARGSLVQAIVPYPEQKPFRLIPAGRGDDPRQHATAEYRLEEYRVGDTRRVSPLPVAALPVRGEEYVVRRGKQRPCLILASTEVRVDASLVRGHRWQTARTRLIVPYYSANGTSSRAGWPPELVARIRRCEYPQYIWDKLPLPGGSDEGSILRLDHAFSIGYDVANVMQTGYRLHDDALEIVEDWFAWYMTGTLAREGPLGAARKLLLESS